MDSHIKLILCAALLGAIAYGQTVEPVVDNHIPMKDRLQTTKTNHTERLMNTVEARISQPKYAWRFTHFKGKLVSVPFFSNGETWSPFDMAECKTLDLIKKEIETLKLTVTEAQQEAINELVEN